MANHSEEYKYLNQINVLPLSMLFLQYIIEQYGEKSAEELIRRIYEYDVDSDPRDHMFIRGDLLPECIGWSYFGMLEKHAKVFIDPSDIHRPTLMARNAIVLLSRTYDLDALFNDVWNFD